MSHLARVALLVREYDEALAFFTNRLGFHVLEDTRLSPTKRWVVVAPPGDGNAALLLARAVGPEQSAAVGRQGGGRVFLFLHTDDFARDFAAFQARGVRFREPPRHETYGTVAVFDDLYGNGWDLVEPRSATVVSGDAKKGAEREPRVLKSVLGYGGVVLNTDGTSQPMPEHQAIAAAIPNWVPLADHERDTLDACLKFATHHHPTVRAAAITAFGDLVVRYGRLGERERVLRAIALGLRDDDEAVRDAASRSGELVKQRLGWSELRG